VSIFVSYSTSDADIVSPLTDLLTAIGVPQESIFQSSGATRCCPARSAPAASWG